MNECVLIADDEPLARRTLREHLKSLEWGGTILEAADGKSAVAMANEQRPELLFLDIVMPAATGIQVLEQLAYEPKVIFTTAYDQYAVAAFELGALDYLLKPFGKDRFEQVLRRAENALQGAAGILPRAKESFELARSATRILVRDGNRIVPIPLANLERAQGADDYVTICAGGKEYLVSVRMAELEKRLSASNFLRIHRSHLINLDHVVTIEMYDTARMQVVMRGGARIVASRAGSKKLRELAI